MMLRHSYLYARGNQKYEYSAVPVLEYPETVVQLRPKKGQDFGMLLVFASTVAGTVLWVWPVIWPENSDKLC